MIPKFKIRNLMVHVAPEEPGKCQSPSRRPTNCDQGAATCDPPPTQCDAPTCPRPSACGSPSCFPDEDNERGAKSLNELAGSNLALLQQELRRALSSER